MTDVNISPVTESEVMTFANRLCTMIVANSNQQAALDKLSEAHTQTVMECDYLRSENASLNTSIGESNTLADSYARERDAAQTELGSVKEKLQGLQDMLVARDHTVSQLRLYNHNLDMENVRLQDRTKHLEFENSNLQSKLSEAEQARDNHATHAGNLHNELVEARSNLEKIRSVFGPVPIPANQDKPEPTPDWNDKATAYTQATQIPITESGAVRDEAKPEPKPPGDYVNF